MFGAIAITIMGLLGAGVVMLGAYAIFKNNWRLW